MTPEQVIDVERWARVQFSRESDRSRSRLLVERWSGIFRRLSLGSVPPPMLVLPPTSYTAATIALRWWGPGPRFDSALGESLRPQRMRASIWLPRDSKASCVSQTERGGTYVNGDIRAVDHVIRALGCAP